ncbi:MAG: FHA domain-containing protein [Prevotella sp.]|nr:FHA domain-containing protein [Prevotella sp.]
MKRVRCPRCDNYVIFDETRYPKGQDLVFQCDSCGKQFGIRIGATPLREMQNAPVNEAEAARENAFGELIVIENMFAFKQILPLKPGDNTIGRYQPGNTVDCAIESGDPSLDMLHCVLTVRHDKHGRLQYVLRDGPSFTGTFVGGDLLAKNERRIISDGTLFTLGATSIILKTNEKET